VEGLEALRDTVGAVRHRAEHEEATKGLLTPAQTTALISLSKEPTRKSDNGRLTESGDRAILHSWICDAPSDGAMLNELIASAPVTSRIVSGTQWSLKETVRLSNESRGS